MSLFNTTAKKIKEEKEIVINNIEETTFSKNYYPYTEDSPHKLKLYFKEFNILDFENPIILKTVEKIKKLTLETDIDQHLFSLRHLLFIMDRNLEEYEYNAERVTCEVFFGKKYFKKKEGKEFTYAKKLHLFESKKASSSNFINFIFDLKLEKKDPDLEESKVIPYLYGFALKDIDKGLRKSSLKDGKFSIEKYKEKLKKFERDPKDFLTSKDFVSPTKIPLTKFLSVLFKEAHDKDPNLVQTISEQIHVELLKSSKDKLKVVEVKGDLIAYFYNHKNYYVKGETNRTLDWLQGTINMDNGGTLGSSCMRYNNCLPKIMFFANNPESVSMLAVLDDNKKIKSRAILWTSLSGTKLMDRIYYSSEKSKLDLKAYAKQNDFISIYDHYMEDDFDTSNIEDFIVKVNVDASSRYPYFDSMRTMDVKNNLISIDSDILSKYLITKKLDGVMMSLPNGVASASAFYYTPSNIGLFIKGKIINYADKDNSLKDINDNKIDNLAKYTIVDLPKRGFYLKEEVKKILGFQKPLPIKYITDLNKKYNSFKKFKYFSKETEKVVEYVTDKQFLVWSNILNSYILKSESKYIPRYNTFFFKSSKASYLLYKTLKERAYKKLFSFSVVRLTKKGFEELKKESLLKDHNVDFQKVRPSRKFFIRPENINSDFITIKNIPINVKYLQKIKQK